MNHHQRVSYDADSATYSISSLKFDDTDPEVEVGSIKIQGYNGLTIETLIDIVVHKLRLYQAALPSRENALALTKLEEANLWLDARRMVDRKVRGIVGTDKA